MKTSRRKWYTRWIAVCVAIVLGVGMYTGMPIHAATSAELTISQNGIDFIKEREGFNAKCYYDGAQSSIGYGTKCGTKAHASGLHSITRADAETAMRNEINRSYIPNVRRQTSGLQMNQNQFDALVSFTYNTGGGTSMIKNSPLVKYLRGEMSQAEATSAFQNYVVTNSATGKVDSGLKNRRRLEAKLFFSGVNPNPPTTATLSKNQVWYDIKDTIVLTVSSDNATNYFLSITKDGNSVVQGIEIPGTYSISAADLGYGDYYAWASAANSSGGVDSNGITFSVVGAAAYSSVETAKSIYSLTDTVSISVSTICAKGQVIGIDKNDTTRVVTEACDSTYQISASQLGVGKYSAYFSVYNGSGGVDTERVTFYIYNPENLGTDFYAYIINTEAWKMLTNESDNNVVMHNETGYAEQIWKFTKNSDNSYKIINCKTGKALDSGGANGNVYTYDDCDNDYQSWYIFGESGAYYLKPKNSNKVLDITSGSVNDGANVQIYDWNGTTAQKFQIWKLDYTPILLGDLNSDNKITSDDLFLLQSYLTNNITLTESQGKAADLNEDGLVDGFDLALLRQKLAG
ncbi:RICIN domain-containing protein [uncultured Ruminococcus sp.]|uniref:RICIN domain-containing protein n=1 Tax=uncultured Ruminococcus sp. TaxID=165186 RepID=UPI0025FEB13D|nr:RICIN domain-containing protein [uncultured Ruminococcus sp.]